MPDAGPLGDDGGVGGADGLRHRVAEEKAEDLGGFGGGVKPIVGGNRGLAQAESRLENLVEFREARMGRGGAQGVRAEGFDQHDEAAGDEILPHLGK